jgi:beta-galactosidase GanA
MENNKVKSTIFKQDGHFTWAVDGSPFLAYAGEIHNSSASNLSYMKEEVWPYISDMNLNTLLVPLYWEKIEEREGEYNFTLLEGIIRQAREHKKKIIFLWFGLWKNGLSSYVPHWVKTDTKRFVRVLNEYKKPMDVISPLCKNAIEADLRAFMTVMTRINEIDNIDSDENTVIAMQIENEMGILGSDRDYSEEANKRFQSEIPDLLKELYKVDGNYTQAFGKDAPEYFMAYHYATAIEQIAAAGKKIYPLPFFVNAWIEKYPWRPGGYPSGGPVAKFIPLWRKLVPSIDVLCPDVYISDFYSLCEAYSKEDNPLLIPEHRRDISQVSNVFYGVGNYNALLFSPFGVEDFQKDPETLTGFCNPNVMKTLAIDSEAWDCSGVDKFLSKSYEVLQSVQEVLWEQRRKNKVYSFIKKDEHEKGIVIETAEYDIKIVFEKSSRTSPKSAGIIIEKEANEFYLLGTSFTFSFLPKKNEKTQIGVLDYEEGNFVDAQWNSTRTLNGDERYYMSIQGMPEIQRVMLYKYE